MFIDCTKFPKDYLFAEQAARALGAHVNVANFSEHRGRRMFRMILDTDLDKDQITRLMEMRIKDHLGYYEFSHIETLLGPLTDQSAHRSELTCYLRATFL